MTYMPSIVNRLCYKTTNTLGIFNDVLAYLGDGIMQIEGASNTQYQPHLQVIGRFDDCWHNTCTLRYTDLFVYPNA